MSPTATSGASGLRARYSASPCRTARTTRQSPHRVRSEPPIRCSRKFHAKWSGPLAGNSTPCSRRPWPGVPNDREGSRWQSVRAANGLLRGAATALGAGSARHPATSSATRPGSARCGDLVVIRRVWGPCCAARPRTDDGLIAAAHRGSAVRGVIADRTPAIGVGCCGRPRGGGACQKPHPRSTTSGVHVPPLAPRLSIALVAGTLAAVGGAAPALASEGPPTQPSLPTGTSPVVIPPLPAPAVHRHHRPVIRRARLVPHRLRHGRRATLRVTLSAPGRVHITIKRISRPHRGRFATKTVTASARRLSIRLPRRAHGRKLAAGRYQISVWTADATGSRSRTLHRTLVVLGR